MSFNYIKHKREVRVCVTVLSSLNRLKNIKNKKISYFISKNVILKICSLFFFVAGADAVINCKKSRITNICTQYFSRRRRRIKTPNKIVTIM